MLLSESRVYELLTSRFTWRQSYIFAATMCVGPACVVLCFAGTPVEVGITMYVLSISSLSEVKMVLDAFTVQHPPF